MGGSTPTGHNGAVRYADGLQVVMSPSEQEKYSIMGDVERDHKHTLRGDAQPQVVPGNGERVVETDHSLDSGKIFVPAADVKTAKMTGEKKGAAAASQRRILGLPRRRFWVLFGVNLAVIILVVIIATLASLLANKDSGAIRSGDASVAPTQTATGAHTSSGGPAPTSDLPSISSSTSSATTTAATPTPVAASSSTTQSDDSPPSTFTSNSSPTTTSGPGGVTVECPWADGTDYSSPSHPAKTFRKQCGVNYMFYDLRNQTVNSFEECLDLCAAETGCVLANWQYWGPQGTDQNYCWLKSDKGEKRVGGGTESGVLLSYLDDKK
ncbi:hypothetical protein DL765_009385 [Monosporascus sp. GIB2]|nr:hypothetical protein DL765_009385 [Monosporascus sp. GIB2]